MKRSTVLIQYGLRQFTIAPYARDPVRCFLLAELL